MTKSNTLRIIEAEAERFGFHKFNENLGGKWRTGWMIVCAGCRVDFRASWGADTSPALMVKNARTRGWDVGLGDRPLCPVCAHKPKHPKPAVSKIPLTVKDIARRLADTHFPSFGAPRIDPVLADMSIVRHYEIPASAGAATIPNHDYTVPKATAERMRESMVQQNDRTITAKDVHIHYEPSLIVRDGVLKRSDAVTRSLMPLIGTNISKGVEMTETTDKMSANPKILRSVFEALSSFFDEKTRLYTGGYSDAKVAQEVGTSETVVAKVRRDAYGELAEDPQVTRFRDDLAKLDAAWNEVDKGKRAEIAALQSRLSQMASNLKTR
jgi:hypothetical protein